MYVWGMTNPITGNWWVPRPPSPHARLLRSAIPVWSKHVFGASHAWLVRSPCLPTGLHGYGCVLQSKHPIQKGISQGWKCVDLISVPSNGIGETSFMHERFNLKSMSSSIIQVNIPLSLNTSTHSHIMASVIASILFVPDSYSWFIEPKRA